MVLRAMPPPAWLGVDAPSSDVVLSSRARYMRNVRGFRFPNTASTEELVEVERLIVHANKESGLNLEPFRQISNAEREYLVGCRLVSPDYEWSEPGRSVLIDGPRSLSLMVNEEDHLRVQALTAGWSIDAADATARSCVKALGKHVEFAESPIYGWLSASPFNAGKGRRLSAMLHLIGLAQAKRLPVVLSALTSKGITARGLFGESSRAVGAFLQVSLVNGDQSEFAGAVEYLVSAEREARLLIGRETIEVRARQAVEFACASTTLPLSDALRVIGWIRWAAAASIEGFPQSARSVDLMLTSLELRGDSQTMAAARSRADFLRQALD